MTRLATSWLVYRLTDSSLLLGRGKFCGADSFLFPGAGCGRLGRPLGAAPAAGMDTAAAAVQSLALAALTWRSITIREIVALSVFQGLINAFDMPARQSFLVQMVDGRNDLSNAIALNSTMVNGARLMGPALPGSSSRRSAKDSVS